MSNNLKQHIGYWINRLRMVIHQSFEARLASYDITIASWCILVAIYDKQASSINELAQYIEVDKASISRVTERLVLRGLLLHRQGKDRRSGVIELTSEGEELVPKLLSEAEQNEAQFFGHLSEAEKKQLYGVMCRIFAKVPGIRMDGFLNN
jgi:DNA-binding MarR family transcriptional regulator